MATAAVHPTPPMTSPEFASNSTGRRVKGASTAAPIAAPIAARDVADAAEARAEPRDPFLAPAPAPRIPAASTASAADALANRPEYTSRS